MTEYHCVMTIQYPTAAGLHATTHNAVFDEPDDAQDLYYMVLNWAQREAKTDRAVVLHWSFNEQNLNRNGGPADAAA